jgi:hypothetical protein
LKELHVGKTNAYMHKALDGMLASMTVPEPE